MMKSLMAAMAVSLLASGANAESTVISPNGARPTVNGPEAIFSGSVTVEPRYEPNEHTSNSGALVAFTPGARSAWHSHPAGQVLIVQSGVGWIQEEGGRKREIKPGDVVWTPPGVKHWHGATATTGMSHLAITNTIEGRNATWMEKVSDKQYDGE
jgi:quercetin dioxygenase-like cupin family protein